MGWSASIRPEQLLSGLTPVDNTPTGCGRKDLKTSSYGDKTRAPSNIAGLDCTTNSSGDSYRVWVQDGRIVEFFLEHDRGTKTIGRLLEKSATTGI
jgi:hypothetical protein